MRESRIARMVEKLAKIKALDRDFRLFGAERHRYELNEPLTNARLDDFEKRYRILLPPDYRLFLSKMGNGGAGPFYGIVELENSLYTDMEHRREDEKTDPSLPFPHTAPQYMFDAEAAGAGFDEEEFYAQWHDPVHVRGILRICNFGCGIFIDLVVNGAEYGNMWLSDIVNDYGIFPVGIMDDAPDERIGFLDWYEQWLDQCFKEMELNENE